MSATRLDTATFLSKRLGFSLDVAIKHMREEGLLSTNDDDSG